MAQPLHGFCVQSVTGQMVAAQPFDGEYDSVSEELRCCHNGVGIGGQMFQKFGLVEEYWKATGSQETDKGRCRVTQDPADLYVFKVPSLRNVVMTPSGDVVDVELMVSHA